MTKIIVVPQTIAVNPVVSDKRMQTFIPTEGQTEFLIDTFIVNKILAFQGGVDITDNIENQEPGEQTIVINDVKEGVPLRLLNT